jgi:hypothetical protein
MTTCLGSGLEINRTSANESWLGLVANLNSQGLLVSGPSSSSREEGAMIGTSDLVVLSTNALVDTDSTGAMITSLSKALSLENALTLS